MSSFIMTAERRRECLPIPECFHNDIIKRVKANIWYFSSQTTGPHLPQLAIQRPGVQQGVVRIRVQPPRSAPFLQGSQTFAAPVGHTLRTATLDGARYDIISIPGKRVTLVTSVRSCTFETCRPF